MSLTDTISVLIAEDEAVTRLGLKFALNTFPDLRLVSECADGIAAILQTLAKHPRVILMDLGLPKVDGITASRKIKEALPQTKIIALTCAEDENIILKAIDAGVDGYCLKKISGERLHEVITAVLGGAFWIDPDLKLKLPEDAAPLCQRKDPRDTSPITEPNLPPMPQHQNVHMRRGGDAVTAPSQTPELNLSTTDVNGKKPGGEPDLTPEQLVEKRASGTIATIIGDRYQIEKVLGRGGMGMVYKGRHIYMNRLVAIKVLHPEQAKDQSIVARFRKEASALCRFSHPNLVAVFDFGVMKSGEPFMVMDFCDGESLDKIIRREGNLKIEQCLDIFSQACEALIAVHSQGMIHRDVKPGNLLLGKDGMIKLVDFGLCKNVGGLENLIRRTCTGEVVGSPSYMSPEQCIGKELDQRSDIYSLGVSMYEALTGEIPFDGDSFYEILNQHIRGTPSREPFLRKNIPIELEEIVFRCIDRDPDARFQSAEELLKALQKAAKLAGTKPI